MRAWVRACSKTCVRACVRACVRVCSVPGELHEHPSPTPAPAAAAGPAGAVGHAPGAQSALHALLLRLVPFTVALFLVAWLASSSDSFFDRLSTLWITFLIGEFFFFFFPEMCSRVTLRYVTYKHTHQYGNRKKNVQHQKKMCNNKFPKKKKKNHLTERSSIADHGCVVSCVIRFISGMLTMLVQLKMMGRF